jgi:hypothetical protein
VFAADVIVFETPIHHKRHVLSSWQGPPNNGMGCSNRDTYSERIKHNTYTPEGRGGLTGNNKGKLGFVLRE